MEIAQIKFLKYSIGYHNGKLWCSTGFSFRTVTFNFIH